METQTRPVKVGRLDRTSKVPPDERYNAVIFGDDTSRDFLIAFKRLPARTPMGVYHGHRRAENILIVLAGTLDAVIGGKHYQAKTDEVIYMPAGIPHATGNSGDVECQAVEIYAPSRGEGPDTDYYDADLPAEISEGEPVRV